MRLNDPDVVAAQYASEDGLEARRSIYANAEGPDPKEELWRALSEVAPRRVLEVGGGPGELAERMARELAAEVNCVDISPRMVEIARGRGLDARLGDVQALDFAAASFDCVVAAWMLYHVPDIDRGLGEIARVLETTGQLVAVTNSEAHVRELREIAGARRPALVFSRENGEQALRRHFANVERRDVDGWVTLHREEAVHDYVRSMMLKGDGGLQPFEVPLRARIATTIFVATK